MLPPAPLVSAPARRRSIHLRMLGVAVATAAVALPAAPAAAHHTGKHAAIAASTAHHEAPAPAAATAPAEHAGHAADSASAAATSIPAVLPEAPSFEVGTPEKPLIARGPRGPLWLDSVSAQPHGTAAERYVAGQLAAARGTSFALPVATRAALTTKQATKKLSKSCQKLVNLKSTKKLSKADKKKRAKCLEQRRKLIKDSKKKPSTGGTKTPGVSAPAPAVEGPKPNPGSSAPTPSNPSNPGTPTPTTPSNPSNPTPTTPSNPGNPTPNPNPTPTPTKPFPACTPGSGTIQVTAIDEVTPFQISAGCAKAGNVTFRLSNNDGNEEDHNLFIGAANFNGFWDGNRENVTPIVATPLPNGGSRTSDPINLAVGKYILICFIEGHELPMQVQFQVFA